MRWMKSAIQGYWKEGEGSCSSLRRGRGGRRERQGGYCNESSHGTNDDNLVNHNNDDNYAPIVAPLTRAQLTLLVEDVEVLFWRRKVIAPRSLFVKNPIIKKANPPSFEPSIDKRMAKTARQSFASSTTGVLSSVAGEDIYFTRI